MEATKVKEHYEDEVSIEMTFDQLATSQTNAFLYSSSSIVVETEVSSLPIRENKRFLLALLIASFL